MTTVYCWTLHSQILEAVLRQLEANGVAKCTVCVVIGREDEFWRKKIPNLAPAELIYPLVEMPDGQILTVRGLIETSPLSLPSSNMEVVVDVAKFTMGGNLPLVTYLDKDWIWSELFLNLIETFGVSVSKISDAWMPEDYMLACLARNTDIMTVKDGELLIEDLVQNGILERSTKYTQGNDCEHDYRFHYHSNGLCLNDNRAHLILESAPLEIISELVYRVSRISTMHSRDFLEFVDKLNFFKIIDVPTDYKSLVDIHYLLKTHKDFMDESDCNSYYLFKNGETLTCKSISEKIRSITSPIDAAALECVMWLKWVLPVDKDQHESFKDLAVKIVIASLDGQKHVPRFLKPLTQNVLYYDIYIYLTFCMSSSSDRNSDGRYSANCQGVFSRHLFHFQQNLSRDLRSKHTCFGRSSSL